MPQPATRPVAGRLQFSDIISNKGLLTALATEYGALKASGEVVDYGRWIRERLTAAARAQSPSGERPVLRSDPMPWPKHPRPQQRKTGAKPTRPVFTPQDYGEPATDDFRFLAPNRQQPEAAPFQPRSHAPIRQEAAPTPQWTTSNRGESAAPTVEAPAPQPPVQRPPWVDAASLHSTLRTGPRAGEVHAAWEPYREMAHLQAAARQELKRADRSVTASKSLQTRMLTGELDGIVKTTQLLLQQNSSLHALMRDQAEQLRRQQQTLTSIVARPGGTTPPTTEAEAAGGRGGVQVGRARDRSATGGSAETAPGFGVGSRGSAAARTSNPGGDAHWPPRDDKNAQAQSSDPARPRAADLNDAVRGFLDALSRRLAPAAPSPPPAPAQPPPPPPPPHQPPPEQHRRPVAKPSRPEFTPQEVDERPRDRSAEFSAPAFAQRSANGARGFLSVRDMLQPPVPRPPRVWDDSPLPLTTSKPPRLRDPVLRPLRQSASAANARAGMQKKRAGTAGGKAKTRQSADSIKAAIRRPDTLFEGAAHSHINLRHRMHSLALLEGELAQAAQENVPPAPLHDSAEHVAWRRLEQLELRMAQLANRVDERALTAPLATSGQTALPAEASSSALGRAAGGAGELNSSGAAGLSRMELARMGDTIEEIERVQAEIYDRWFGSGGAVDPTGAPAADGQSPRSAANAAEDDLGVYGAAAAGRDPASKDARTSANQESRSLKQEGSLVDGGGVGRRYRQTRGDSSNVGAVDAAASRDRLTRCSSDEDAVTPGMLKEVLAGRDAFLEVRAASDAVLAAAGGATDATFNPVAVVEAVTDAVIDDIIQQHVEEMLHICDHCADGMFSAEFA